MYELLEIPDLDERRWQKAQAMASYLATTYKNGIIPTTGDLFGEGRKEDGVAMIDIFPMLVKELKKHRV